MGYRERGYNRVGGRQRERERDREIDRRGICTVFQPRGESVLTQRGEVSLYD